MKQGLRITKDTRIDKDSSQTMKQQQQQLIINKLYKPTLKYKPELDRTGKLSKDKAIKPTGTDYAKNSRTKSSKLKMAKAISPKNSKVEAFVFDPIRQLDEKSGDQPTKITSHRFSDIYKPSKFLNDTTKLPKQMENENPKMHLRHKSLMQANSMEDTNSSYRPDYDYNKVCITEAGDDYYYMRSDGRSPSPDTFQLMQDISLSDKRRPWKEETQWEFQAQYKNERTLIEVKILFWRIKNLEKKWR